MTSKEKNKTLYILFSEIIISEITTDDIILTNSTFLQFTKNNYEANQIHCIDEFELDFKKIIDNASKEKEVFKISNTFFQNKALLLDACYNVLVNNTYIPVIKWKVATQHLIEQYRITKIVLSEEYRGTSYTPFYEAEGEIHRPLFYKKYDFIPTLLRTYLTNNTSIKVRTIVNKNVFQLKMRIFLRRYVFFIFVFFTYLVKTIFSSITHRQKSNNLINRDEPHFLFLSRGIAHSHYMYPFLAKYKNTSVHASESFFALNQNYSFFAKNNIPVVSAINSIKFINIFKAFLTCFKLLLSPVSYSNFSILNLSFNYKSIEKEIIIYYFHALIYEASIENYIEKLLKNNIKNIVLISGEMLTIFPWVVKRLADKYELKSCQLQTTLMMSYPQPYFIPCDKFLFKSKDDCEIYKNNNPTYAHKMSFWGNLASIKNINQQNNRRLLFFTQPYETHIEHQVLDTIKNFNCESRGLKLHPRDHLSKFTNWINDFTVVPGYEYIDDYLSQFDVCILRTSSIAQDIILKGIPIIFCLFSDTDKNVKADYLNKDYYGTVTNTEELIRVLNNPKKLNQAFIQFRKNYIQKGNLNEGIDHFERKLTEFANT